MIRNLQYGQRLRLSQLPSADAMIGLFLLPVTCLVVLVEAYGRTDLADAQRACDCGNVASDAIISNAHLDTLNRNGIVVIDRVLSLNRLTAIRHAIGPSNISLQQRYTASGNDPDVRQDRIQWVRIQPQQQQQDDNGDDDSSATTSMDSTTRADDDDTDAAAATATATATATVTSADLNYAIALVRGIAHRLENGGGGSGNNSSSSSVSGGGTTQVTNDNSDSSSTSPSSTSASSLRLLSFARHLLVPRDCQLAVYPPSINHRQDHDNGTVNVDVDMAAATTGVAGAGYARHLDRCTAELSELGLVEYWRLTDYRNRVITIILYLNEDDRPVSDGGALRYWKVTRPTPTTPTTTATTTASSSSSSRAITTGNDEAADDVTVDIYPVGGKMVIFYASRIHHQVLPSFGTSDRIALTCWVTGELLVVPPPPSSFYGRQ
jgi:2OG-Fe(II) oxygenase superfamily